MDLTTLSKKELLKIKSNVIKELKKRQLVVDQKLLKSAQKTQDSYLIAFAKAILHKFHQIEPEINVALILSTPPFVIKNTKLFNKLNKRLDIIEYVFEFTDFNVCENGKFYRR